MGRALLQVHLWRPDRGSGLNRGQGAAYLHSPGPVVLLAFIVSAPSFLQGGLTKLSDCVQSLPGRQGPLLAAPSFQSSVRFLGNQKFLWYHYFNCLTVKRRAQVSLEYLYSRGPTNLKS